MRAAAHKRAHVLRPCARMCARAIGRARIRADTCGRLPPASTACGFGVQAFQAASAFNANIGAWNTASVTSLSSVFAAPGPAARTMADALGRASVRRGRLCAAAPPMRARVHTRAGTRLRGAVGVGTAARRGGSVHVHQYICIYVCVCVSSTFIHTFSIYPYM